MKYILIIALNIYLTLCQNNLLFFDFPSPDTINRTEIRNGIDQRKIIWRDHILGRSATFDTSPVFIANNVNFNFAQVVQPILDGLDTEIDPDFRLMTLVRILFLTEDFNTEILEAILRIKLWLTPNEDTRVYWTENHQIMYSAAAYLLRQKFGVDAFPSDFFDENLDTRLEWFLRTKKETGFFEFNSPIYYQFTTAGLLLLHDFADNSTIKQDALDLLLLGVREWMPITSSEGVVTQSAARAFTFFYFDNMFGNGAQQVIAFLTGLGPLIDTSSSIRAVTAALVLTTADLSEAVSSYSSQQSSTRQIGLADSERAPVFTQLPGFDRHIAQLTMGLFGDPTHINDLFDFLSFFNLFGREDFEPLQTLENIPPGNRVPFAEGVLSIGVGSSYYVPEFVSYKDNNVVLTSCNDYFPGFKGYQQFPNMAAISTTSVFTFAIPENLFFDRQGSQTQLLGNNQIPYLRQKENVLVTIYNPRRDLSLLFQIDVEVMFHFDESQFDEVVNNENWVFGRLNSGFVGVYREQCVSPVTSGHRATPCNEEVQIWITVVGTLNSHQDFASFQSSLVSSDLSQLQRSDNCGSVVATVDGQEFDELFCQGNVDIDTGGNGGGGDSGDNGGGNGGDNEEEPDEDENDELDLIQLAQFGGGGVLGLSIVFGIGYAISESRRKKKRSRGPRVPQKRQSNDKVPITAEVIPESSLANHEIQTIDDLERLNDQEPAMSI